MIETQWLVSPHILLCIHLCNLGGSCDLSHGWPIETRPTDSHTDLMRFVDIVIVGISCTSQVLP